MKKAADSTKPTPGPYHVREHAGDGYSVVGIHGITIGWFSIAMIAGEGSYTIELAEAKANAEAFMRALESAAGGQR